MKNIEKIVKDGISSKKYKIGTREVIASIKGSKLVIVSNSVPQKIVDRIAKDSKDLGVPMIKYEGSSIKLGKVCNRQFKVSAICLKAGSDEDIKEIVSEK